jgi:protein-L-isoaspartate(D-aspartate) O-methyltransferase
MIAEQIYARGVHDPKTLAAIESTPREHFVPANLAPHAYEDRALPIDESQTISQPYIVALMTAALQIKPHSKILEIGTGSGYQAAILARLAASLHTIERFDSLSKAAQFRLTELGLTNIQFHVGDGSVGLPDFAPFDRIIVTAGAPATPQPLVEQLTDAGRLVIPIGDDSQQRLVVITRKRNRTVEQPLIACRFVKLIGDAAWQ